MPSRPKKFGPNIRLRAVGQKAAFRLGLLVTDSQNHFWALTSKRHLFDHANVQIVTDKYIPFGHYSEQDNERVERSSICSLIARIKVDGEFINAADEAIDKIWPRSACRPEDALGAEVFSSAGFQELGIVTETDSTVRISLSEKAGPLEFEGAYKVQLVANRYVKSGTGGMLYLSRDGDAIGIAIAYSDRHVIVGPLSKYLEAYDLKPWSPLYTYWNNIPHRLPFLKERLNFETKRFLEAADALVRRS